jgi:hypothetical protein
MTRRFRKRLPRLRDGFRREIVKVQRIDTAPNGAQVLITNQDRSVTARVPLDGGVATAVGEDFVQYWIADVPEAKGELKLLKITKEQSW